ncbi:PREDICTED: zinc finger protein 808-like [Diuraphis noxia]|uniref:zinc finger protein 808-like n=1 Tax=Diuraphis noxia TaxID=143948 RepID=UPI0007636DFA|nr:PREDICTED: zinc finger protein 808-like [Diuraphis noxia]
MSQTHLHSENFDLCRVCLLEPESDRNVKFVHILTPVAGEMRVKELMLELLGINVEINDIKPKIICENCYKTLLAWMEVKKKAGESEIVISYIASKKYGVNKPGTSIGTTPTLMIRSNGESSQESSFQHGTSIGTTPTLMIRSNGESSQESSFQHSQLSQSSNIYGPSTSRMCIASTSSQVIINNGESSSFRQSQFISSSRFVDDSDDDSCIEVPTQIPTVDLVSDDDVNDVDSSNYDEETIVLSSDNEENQLTFKNENFNDETEKLYYCSICQKKNILNHDCSQHTKSFFTCLVPNCNVLSRSKNHFTSHYLLHIGMSSSAVLCDRCFQEIEQSDIDRNGCHIRCNTANAFKCYTCNVRFNGMQEFAFHKLKTHNGLLMDIHGDYLCLHCEESSPELTVINEHMKHCLNNQENNVNAAKMKPKKPTVNETALLPVQNNYINNASALNNGNKGKIPRTSDHILFTCLKPSCNLIFQTFRIFKAHHRDHFNLGETLICWQCCKPFNNASHLRAHQVKYNCRTPGMFKCSICPEKFDDIESFSIHKFTFHDGVLMAAKKNRKSIMCAFCQMDINIFNFQSHLIACKKKNVNKNTTKKQNGTYNCQICGKVFLSSISLSNHSRIHNPSRSSSKF